MNRPNSKKSLSGVDLTAFHRIFDPPMEEGEPRVVITIMGTRSAHASLAGHLQQLKEDVKQFSGSTYEVHFLHPTEFSDPIDSKEIQNLKYNNRHLALQFFKKIKFKSQMDPNTTFAIEIEGETVVVRCSLERLQEAIDQSNDRTQDQTHGGTFMAADDSFEGPCLDSAPMHDWLGIE